jgi:hypothetical protein
MQLTGGWDRPASEGNPGYKSQFGIVYNELKAKNTLENALRAVGLYADKNNDLHALLPIPAGGPEYDDDDAD